MPAHGVRRPAAAVRGARWIPLSAIFLPAAEACVRPELECHQRADLRKELVCVFLEAHLSYVKTSRDSQGTFGRSHPEIMKVEIRFIGALYLDILEDLARPHPFAAERVGFACGR